MFKVKDMRRFFYLEKWTQDFSKIVMKVHSAVYTFDLENWSEIPIWNKGIQKERKKKKDHKGFQSHRLRNES